MKGLTAALLTCGIVAGVMLPTVLWIDGATRPGGGLNDPLRIGQVAGQRQLPDGAAHRRAAGQPSPTSRRAAGRSRALGT
ncbi:MAG TPA: hypothetical protein VK390_05025 [Propionibacteriaceae bacterium]|nr:hypothetical protein [Propionibacteriaceae bacterium]